jgi:hypothetical protein
MNPLIGVYCHLPINTSVPLDGRFHSENQQLKINAWKEGPFATGFVPATWDEEYASYRNDVRSQCMKLIDNDNTTIAYLMGPYWPILLFVIHPLMLGKGKRSLGGLSFFLGMFHTYPHCFFWKAHPGVSGLTLITVIPHKHPLLGLVCAILTVGLNSVLALTAFRDPGRFQTRLRSTLLLKTYSTFSFIRLCLLSH